MKRLLFVNNSPKDSSDQNQLFPDSAFPMPVDRVNLLTGDEVPDLSQYTHIIGSGCVQSVCAPEPWMEKLEALFREAMERNINLLGICFSHQMLAKVVGGAACVRPRPVIEIGWVEQTVLQDDPLLGKKGDRIWGMVGHYDEVTTALPPEKTTILMNSPTCEVEAFRVNGKNAWGVQGHFEIGIEAAKKLTETLAADDPKMLSVIQNADNPRDDGFWETLRSRFCALD